MALAMSAGYQSRVSGVHSSGWCTKVRSCTVATMAALRAGGTMKLGEWTTSTRPVIHSMGGRLPRRHNARVYRGDSTSQREAMGTDGPTAAATACDSRHATAYPVTSMSGRATNRSSTAAAKVPTPVGGLRA